MSNITVLTPAYNRGKLLEKLYESLCAQDCKDFEWLIVDDGSTDDTSERVEQMKQTADFPISYHRKENGGKHTALNYAYQFIKTPLTFIVDSDDSLTRDAISYVNEIYKRYKNESDLCGFSFLRGKPDGGYLSTSGVPQDGMKESYVECRINRSIGGDMAEVWYTHCLKEYLFPEFQGEKFLGEDIVWVKMSEKYKMRFFNRVIYISDYLEDDAIEAGFNHVVFIIRKDIEKEFKEVIGDRIASICSSHNVTVDYAFQDINDIPGTLPEGRTKPWGTGQAVLAAKKVIKTPFIVINADDYYGKEGFKAVHEYLVNGGKSCMAGFVLKNTLSDNGGVTRGICKMDEQNNLTEVVETKNIVKTANGAEADGVAVDVNSLVSMNMWGLTPDFLDVLEEGFKEFFEKEVPGNPQKAEYLIPIFIGELLEQGKMSVKVLKTNDTWYGMTYHEDVAAVKGSFKEMLENGVYKADLFSDL